MNRSICTALLFFLVNLFNSPVWAQANAEGVSLEVPELWHQWGDETRDGRDRSGTPLLVELTRQSILIAAREELGLRTLDPSLGEPAEGEGVVPLGLGLDIVWQEGAEIELWLGDDTLLEHTIEANYWNRPGIIQSVALHTNLSIDQVPQALRNAGFEGEANAWHDSAAVPEAIQELVDELSLVSQFRAARALHALIREEGESPERLWALSRVYANLGQESRWFIRSQFAVFQARSLLYAQRLSVKAPTHPLGDLAVAYAWTMASYTRTAAAQLNAFDNREHEDMEQWLEWARLLRACCEYDTQTLNDIIDADGPAV